VGLVLLSPEGKNCSAFGGLVILLFIGRHMPSRKNIAETLVLCENWYSQTKTMGTRLQLSFLPDNQWTRYPIKRVRILRG